MMIQAAIFDLDGLMIESERIHFDAMETLLARYSKKPVQEWFKDMIGMDNMECAEFVIAQTSLPISSVQFNELVYEIINERSPGIFTPKHGLLSLINDLVARDIKLGVASNSRSDYVTTALATMKVIDKFECILTSDDVKNAKPAPDMYLAAAQCLGVPPQNCMGVEDSPHGMKAALNAGMSCVVVPNSSLKEADFPGATYIYSSLEEFRQSLSQVLNTETISG